MESIGGPEYLNKRGGSLESGAIAVNERSAGIEKLNAFEDESPRDCVNLRPFYRKPQEITPSSPSEAKDVKELSQGIKEEKSFRFAPRFTIDEVMNNPERAQEFVHDYLTFEAAYFAIARDAESSLTYDGINLDLNTGAPQQIRDWSAPSKESLDVGICVKALLGDEKAAIVVSKDDPSGAPWKASEILRRKLDSYQRFYEQNPGYGGFMPWFKLGSEIKPMPDWEAQIPGLDNGEWAWSLLAAEYALKKKGYGELAGRYGKYNEMLRENAVKIFYDPIAGKVRGDVKVIDPQSPDSAYEPAPGKCLYLEGEHGVHEGSMMLFYVSLMGKGLPQDALEKIWETTKMERVETQWGTTWKGFWGSSHESWAHLFLPLRDVPAYHALFRIREKIRSQNAAMRGYPGFAASTQEPGGTGYFSDCGIEGVGSQPINHNYVFAIYGVFPMLLEFASQESKTGNYGLAWLLNMLKGQKMQGPLGGGESATNNGKLISSTKTIDGTFPNILAMTGGLARENAEIMKQYGVYEKFKNLVENELKDAFG